MKAYPPYLDLGPLHHAAGTIRMPGSKSISNRTLLLAALAQGVTEIRDLLAADDVDRMLDALQQLGVRLDRSDPQRVLVTGCSGSFPLRSGDLFLGNAGTALRPLTAALALNGGHYTLSGVPRMHERPIGDLVEALRALISATWAKTDSRLWRSHRRRFVAQAPCACAAMCRASSSQLCSWPCR
jgi:3-phosphoshikimate 1-carboxyvinyltransferase